MWGLRKQLEPVLVEGRQTLVVAQEQLHTLVWLAAAVLAVSLLTLAMVINSV